MRNDNRNKLRRIDVFVKSYGSGAKWFLETDNFETELTDGETNVIDFKMDPIKKSRLSSLVDVAKNRCCSKDEEPKNKKKVTGSMLHSFVSEAQKTRKKIVLLRSLLISNSRSTMTPKKYSTSNQLWAR